MDRWRCARLPIGWLVAWMVTVTSPSAGQEAPTADRNEGPFRLVEPLVAWADADLMLPQSVASEPSSDLENASPTPLTIDDLQQMALVHNPTLALAARRVAALRGRYLQVGLYPNPTIGYIGEEIGLGGHPGQHGAYLTQKIVTAGKLGLNRAVVSHEITRAEQEVEMQRYRVLNDVRAAAYELLAAQRNMALSEQLVRIGEEGQEVAQELLRAQEVSRVDLLRARIEANSAKLLSSNATNDHKAAWRKLALVVGIPDLAPAEVQDQSEDERVELAWQSTLDRLLASSPELARAHADVQRAKCDLARAYAGRVPDVQIQAGARYATGAEDALATAGFSLPLRLYDRNQGNIHRARAELAAARQEVLRVRLALENRLAETFREYANSRQQVQRYEKDILPDAKDSLELVRQVYRQGEFSYLELLTAQRTYFRANVAYVQARRDLQVSRTRIEGLLLFGALKAPGAT